ATPSTHTQPNTPTWAAIMALIKFVQVGIWAGVIGIGTIGIVGNKSAWMIAPISAMIIGLLSARNDRLQTSGQGLSYGLANGATAGLLLIVGQLLRSLWIDPLAGEQPITLS